MRQKQMKQYQFSVCLYLLVNINFFSLFAFSRIEIAEVLEINTKSRKNFIRLSLFSRNQASRTALIEQKIIIKRPAKTSHKNEQKS